MYKPWSRPMAVPRTLPCVGLFHGVFWVSCIWLYFVVNISLAYGFCDCTDEIATEIPEAECEALVALFVNTNGPYWKINSNWITPGTSVDTWTGVTVSDGHVSGISLFRNRMTGTIPPEIQHLAYLDRLDLSDNELTGPIPPELGNLSKLTRLALWGNSLTGAIPSELANLQDLYELVLSGNQFEGSIPSEFGRMVNLIYLGLSSNRLTGSIPSELENLIHLEYLLLSGNSLGGSIPEWIGSLMELREIYLGNNQLIGNIPPTLKNLKKLRMLYFSVNQLTGHIPPELGELTNLEEMSVGWNQLTGSIPPELGELRNLRYLNLAYNRLNGIIPREVGNLTNISSLWLSSNRLSGEVPETIVNLTDLKSESWSTARIDYNMLTSSNTEVIDFLNKRIPYWDETQTIPPSDISIIDVTASSVQLDWSPIPYTEDGGFYRIKLSTSPGGPYSEGGVTSDKSVSQFIVQGLSPGTVYFFVIETFTPAHETQLQVNDLTSFPSDEVSVITLPIRGDLSNDQNVDIADAILALQVLAGNDMGGTAISLAADVNQDDRVGLEDAVYILRVSSLKQ